MSEKPPLKVAGYFAVSPKRDCPHLTPDHFTPTADFFSSVTMTSPCINCENKGENWVCLKCAEVKCSRYVGNHMVQHYETAGHAVAISFSDLSVWCYICDSYIESCDLAVVLRYFQTVKFGPEMEALAKSLKDLTVEESKQEEPRPQPAALSSIPEEAEPSLPEEQKIPPQPPSPPAIPKKWHELTLPEVCARIQSGEFTNVTVMTGAGISVSAGIPDFRTPGTGLYSQLAALNLPSPEAVFTLSYFIENPTPFCTLAKDMFGKTYKPTPTHYFIRLLHEKGLLHMCFTQNIDGLELKAGLPVAKLVQAHGHCDSSHCTDCKREYPHDRMMELIREGQPARCEHCGAYAKPDIVFYGESLPDRFMIEANNLKRTDLLIVIGTSLVVFPFAALVSIVPDSAPRILINRESVGNMTRSNLPNHFQGECDNVVWEMSRALGWEAELRALVDS